MLLIREIGQWSTRYLDWELNVEPGMLKKLEDMICKDIAGSGPYLHSPDQIKTCHHLHIPLPHCCP